MRTSLLGCVFALVACAPAPEPATPAPPLPPSSASAPVASSPAPVPSLKAAPRVPVEQEDIRWGDDQAPVTAVFFGRISDRPSATILGRLQKLQDALGPSRLRIVWKFSKGPVAVPFEDQLSQGALGLQAVAGGAAARSFLEVMMQKHEEIRSFEALLAAAQAAGLKDSAAFEKCLTAGEFLPLLDAHHELELRLGNDRTPTLFINGYRVAGLAPTTALRGVIEDELARVEELQKAGKSREEIYTLRTQHNTSHEQVFSVDLPSLRPGAYRKVDLGKSPALGGASAPVTVVMFGGVQDPFSQKAWLTMKALQKRYGDDLRLVWKDAPMPFHRASLPLASLAREVRASRGEVAFWGVLGKMLEAPFWARHRTNLLNAEKMDAQLVTVYRELGVKGPWQEVVNKHKNSIEQDVQAWRGAGAVDTPAFFINGRYLSGAQPEQTFVEAIDSEMTRARAKIQTGVRPEDVYRALQDDLNFVEDL